MEFIYKITFISALLSLAVSLQGLAANATIESYPATIEDGTAKVIRSNTAPDSGATATEEFLAPAKVEENTATESETDRAETDDEGSTALAPAATAPAPISTKPKSEKTLLEERASEMAQVRSEMPTNDIPTAPAAAIAVSAPVASNTRKSRAFDNVPAERIAELSQRIKIASDILSRFGRAYDYRTTTLSDFKRIASELASPEKNRKAN